MISFAAFKVTTSTAGFGKAANLTLFALTSDTASAKLPEKTLKAGNGKPEVVLCAPLTPPAKPVVELMNAKEPKYFSRVGSLPISVQVSPPSSRERRPGTESRSYISICCSRHIDNVIWIKSSTRSYIRPSSSFISCRT